MDTSALVPKYLVSNCLKSSTHYLYIQSVYMARIHVYRGHFGYPYVWVVCTGDAFNTVSVIHTVCYWQQPHPLREKMYSDTWTTMITYRKRR